MYSYNSAMPLAGLLLIMAATATGSGFHVSQWIASFDPTACENGATGQRLSYYYDQSCTPLTPDFDSSRCKNQQTHGEEYESCGLPSAVADSTAYKAVEIRYSDDNCTTLTSTAHVAYFKFRRFDNCWHDQNSPNEWGKMTCENNQLIWNYFSDDQCTISAGASSAWPQPTGSCLSGTPSSKMYYCSSDSELTLQQLVSRLVASNGVGNPYDDSSLTTTAATTTTTEASGASYAVASFHLLGFTVGATVVFSLF